MSPQKPLLDQTQLDDAFSKYTGSDIDQRTAQTTPFTGLGSPSPSVVGGQSMSSLDKLTQDITKPDLSSGKLTPGGRSLSLGELSSQPFSIYDPALQGKDEDMLSLNQSFWDKAANGVIKMGGIALNTAISSTVGTINGLGKWAETGKFSSFIDNDFNKQLDVQMQELEKAFPHYRTAHEREGSWYEPENLFTANFLFDKVIKNLGFSVGAGLPALAVGKALNALKVSSRLFAAGEALTVMETMEKAVQLPRLQQLGFLEGQLNTIVNSGKSLTGRALKSLGAPTLGGVEQGGALVRGVSSALSSIGEASMEGFNNLNEFRNDKIREYKKLHNGIEPTGADLDKINEAAHSVGTSSFLLNAALLSGTEYVQLPKIFSSTFKGEKNLLNRTIRNAETGTISTIERTGIKKFGYNARKFGSLFFNEAEAFEEGSQFTIQKGTQDYYDKKYRGEGNDFIQSLGYGIGQTLTTDEGLENIFLGGLSGALMTARGKYQQGQLKADNTNQFVAGANNFNFKTYLKEGVDQANRAITIQQQREDAIRQGDILESKDLEFDYSHNYLYHRIKWGRFDLVEQDINETLQEAAMLGGLAKLQQEGKASETDTLATLTDRLNNFREHAQNVKQQYEDLNTKYAGLSNPDGTAKYTPEVLDKMVYAASKVKDYDGRIKQLGTELLANGVDASLVNSLLNTSDSGNDQEFTARVTNSVAEINSMDILEDKKEDLKTKLSDYLEIALRRKQYIQDYKDLKNTPEKFKESEAPIATPKTDTPTTVKIKTKDGEEDLEIGTEYYAGAKQIEVKEKNGTISKFSKFTIVKENEDGSVIISSNGKLTTVSKSVFEQYKIGKVADTDKKENAKFFIETTDHIFTYQLGKGKTMQGSLSYDPKTDKLYFESLDGKTKRQVTRDQFNAKKGYNQAQIYSNKKFSPRAEQASQAEVTKEELKDKRGERLRIITELHDETSAKLENSKKLIEQKKAEFKKIDEELDALTEKISKGDLTDRNNFKATTNRAIKAANKLSRAQEQLRLELEQLEAEQEQLELNISYIEDLKQSLDLLPEDSKEFLEELNDQVIDLEILHTTIGKQINATVSLIESIGKALDSAIDYIRELLSSFESKYPKVPSPEGQEWIDFLKSNPNFLKVKPDYRADLREVEDLISAVEDLDVNPKEATVKELTSKLKGLQEDLVSIEKEITAKEAILNKFLEVAKTFKANEAQKVKLAQDKAIQEKYFVQQKAQEQNSGIATEDKIPAKEPARKDLINGPISGTDPAWENTTADNNFHRRHQTFEFNMTSNDPAKFNQENKAKMRIIPVSSVTTQELGFAEDWIDPQYRFDGKNVDTAAIRYVYVIQEGKQLFYTDVNGNKLGEVGKESVDTTKIIYTNAETTSFKDGQEGEFTDKNNLGKEKVRKAWKELRAELFKIKASEIRDYAYNFKTSRGFLNQTQGVTRNTNLFDAGIITAQDLNNVVIDIPGNSQKFPKGVPMFNYAGNTFFLNNRKLSEQEATQVYDILVYAATHKEGFSNRVFDYLKNVIYFSTSRDENKQLKRNQIFLKKDEEFPALVIGENEVEIQFIPFSTSDGNNLVDKKAEIIGFLKEAYHHVNSSTLSKQKEGITKFNELSVEGDEIKIKEWPSYQHYLLEQRKGEQSPLTANVAIPQEREVPIKEKYPIVEFKSFDIGTPAPTTKQETLSDRGDIFDTTSNIFRNADNTISRVEVTSIKYTSEFKVGETTFKAGDEIKHIVPADAIKVIEDNLKAKHSPKVEVKEKSEKLIVDFQGFKITMIVDRDANKAATKLTVESMIATSGVPGTTEGQDYKDAYKGILPQIEAGFLAKLNAKKETEVVQKQDEVKPETKDSTKPNVDDLLDDSDGEFEDAREATDNYKTYHGDKQTETEDVSFMLPQVKQYMVKNLISMIGGGKAWGLARSRMMEIYEGAPFGTKYHESFEQVFNWILSPSEQNDLWEEFKSKEGTFLTYKGETKPYSEATFKEAKEEMAENFIEYKQTATKPKPSNKIIQFFKDLWNFLKEMLNTHPATIANVFDKLNNGVYRIVKIRATKGEEYRERSVQGESVSFVNTMLSGMTADMFIAKWQDDVGIIMDLEENPGEAEGKLFSELKSRMIDYFENPKNRAGVITYYKFLIKKETDPAKIQELKDSLEEVLKAWSRVKNQWTNYTEELKSFLRTFDISFQVDDEGNLALDSNIDENEINNRDYMEDRMTINAKNSASKVVKLLMATISDSQFRGVVEKSIKAVIDNSTVPVRDNSMRMKMLVPYAKLFNYILHNTTGLQGIYSIVGKLQEISENTNIKQNANVKGVLDRIKFNTENYFKGFSLPQIKMILKLESALSKYKPLFMSQELTEEGKTINKPSSKFGRIEQLTTEWANNLKSSPYATVTGDTIQLSEKLFSFDPFIFVKNLGIPITKSTGITKEEKEEIEKEITAIQGFLKPYIKEPLPLIEKGKNTGVDGRLKRLAKFYVENVEGESTESQHYNKNGKVTANFVLPNFISYIIGDANNSASIEEFIQKNPQYNDLYMKDSYILNNIIYKDGKLNKKLNIVVVEGKSSYGENRPTDKMVEGERMLYEINNNLKGIFYTLMPSDSKTEYAVDWGNIVDKEFFNPTFKERATDSYVDKLFNHLLNEIELAKDYNSRSFIKALTRTLKGEKNSLGKQLRFFKHILSKESVDKIQNSLINEKKTLTPEELTKFKEVFKKEIAAYITKQASLNINDLTSWGLIKDGTLYGFDNDFMTSTFNKNGKQHNLTPQQIQELFEFREMNYVFSNIEMHKMFFNDPYQSKDALKRTKSFLNGREYSHVDTLNDEQGLNEALKQQLNKGLQPTDIGWHNFKNHLNTVNIKNVITHSKHYEEIAKAIKNAKAYLEMDISNAQSWASGNAYREILYKAGGRFTSQQEELHQWLMAWERRDKNKYSSEVLRQSDNLILSNSIPNSDKHKMYILKPIVSGTRLVDGVAVQYLSKTSTAPLYYYFVKGTPLEQVYNAMQKNNIDYIATQEANKIGELTNNTIPLFNVDGNVSEEFEKVTSTPFLFKHFGIQVDTAATHDKQTQGSQLTKLAIVDLMEAGIPVDFIRDNAGLSREDLEEKWNSSDKFQSPIWKAVQEHNKALIGLAIKRTQTVLDKLGIKKEDFGYSFRDKEIVAEFILNELERRELPDNIAQGIATSFNPDTQTNEFTTPLEANVNYQKIKQILWSVIQKGVTQPKINGAPAIQMSVAGFGTIREVEINGKKVFVDDTLKFYSSKDNGVTDACEIYLPYFFGEKLRNSPQFKEMEEKEFHEKVITFLNTTEEGQSLLKGIGFRIPTQALNSIEFFKVKKFLAPQLGDVIVLPAEITTKAGSDFDVDKLNIYLRNWYIGSKGFPKPVKFKNIDTNNEQQLTDLYKDTLKNKRKEWESNQAYDRLMSKIDNTQEDSNYIPTLEEFIAESKGKDAMEVNSIEALENRYIDSLETLISLPENFKALVTPNDASQLSTISDEIQVLMNNVDEDITPGHLISSNFMAKKRNTMLSSKNSVGISAVSATNLATNQFKRIILLIADKFVKKNVKIRLPHNKLGSGISLGHITNAEGDSISNINAQFTDGTVDVAKKEWLPRMGFTDRTISTALLMNKWGTPPRHIAFFINQPAIQKYLKEREIQENISKITRTKARSANESQTDVIATFTQTNLFAARKIKPDAYNLKEKVNLGLEDMIGKDLNSLTDAQKLRQVQILDDYIAYQEMSGQLLKYVQGNNWDTSKLSSPEDVYSKILDTKLAEEQPIIGSLDGTYFSEVKKSVTNLSEALQTLFFTQKGKALSILQDFAKSFKNQIGIDGDTYTKYMNKVENSLIDFLVQTSSLNGVELHTYIKPLLQSNFAAANYVKKLQQDILDPSHPLKNNKFLLNLSTDIDVKHEKASATSIVEPDFDTFTSDSLTDQFRELLEDNSVVKIDNNPLNNRLVSQVFQNVLLAQILQSGSNRKQGSFFHLIPNEVYTKYVNSALTDVNLDAFKDNALFYRNNFRDNILVPALTPDYDSGEFDSFTYDMSNVLGNSIVYADAFKYKNFPVVKIVSRENKKVTYRIFKRVDIENSPVIIKKTKEDFYDPEDEGKENVIYKEITPLGDGNKAQEYYSDSTTSLFNPKITEVADESIVGELQKRGRILVYSQTNPVSSSMKVNVSNTPYTKQTPQNKTTGFFFTENLQAYLANRARGAEVNFALAPDQVKLDVTATNNQAGIRRNNGIRNLNSFAIISKKFQQDGKGNFVKEAGQFKDTEEDFELFKKYNQEAIQEALSSNLPLIISGGGIATGKSALPLRFVEWLKTHLETELGISGEIKENTSTGYKGYGLFNLTSTGVQNSTTDSFEQFKNILNRKDC